MCIAAYLAWSGQCKNANQALAKFGNTRTSDGKGVTIPSQMRYVHYVAKIKEEGKVRPPKCLVLQKVRFITIPKFDGTLEGGGCDPYFHIKVGGVKVYDYSKHNPVKKAGAKLK